MSVPKDILDLVSAVQAKGEAVAVATVVRTMSNTAVARAGARTVITADETLSGGWIGPASGAVLRAARQALADGQPRLISVQPETGSDASRGAMDIFVEPVLPRPILAIFGASPVAVALSDFARRVGFFVAVCAPAAEHAVFTEADRLVGIRAASGSGRRPLSRDLDPGRGRSRGAVGSRSASRQIFRHRRPAQKNRFAQEQTRRRKRRGRGLGKNPRAGRTCARRDHAGGNRSVHRRRDDRSAAARPALALSPRR